MRTFQNFLTEAKKSKTPDESFDVTNTSDLKKKMKDLGKNDNKCRVVSVTFGKAFVNVYDSVSKIPNWEIGYSKDVFHPELSGYWQGGVLKPWPEKLLQKYQMVDYGPGD